MFQLDPYDDNTAYNPKEAAERGPFTEKTLAKWRWAGDGPRHFKIGGRCYYRGSELNAFLRSDAEAVT